MCSSACLPEVRAAGAHAAQSRLAEGKGLLAAEDTRAPAQRRLRSARGSQMLRSDGFW